jgi:hypothetical protein
VTLQEIEARLRREPELNKLGPEAVEALARAVMRFVQGGTRPPAEGGLHASDIRSFAS